MDPNQQLGEVREESFRQEVDQEAVPEYRPPGRNLAPFIIIGVLFLIILIFIGSFFLFFRTRTSTDQQDGASTLSPQPTPSFSELLSSDIQEQEGKLNEIRNDITELDMVFKYESVNFSDVLTPPPAQTAEWEAQKTEIAKKRAELEIERRVATLDKLGPKISAAEKLSSLQKSQLNSEVESEIVSLSSLKSRIMSQTNFNTLALDISTLSGSIKNYQVVVPKVLIVVIADKINVAGDSFTVISDKLTQKTGELQSLGKNVDDVQKALGHMLFVLGDTANKAESASVSVFPLSSSEYPKNKSVLLDANGKIQASHKNLGLAVSDGKNILNSLIAIESGKEPSRDFFQLFPLFRQ